MEGGDFKAHLNPDSVVRVDDAWMEPALLEAQPATQWQFERLGYFSVDAKDSEAGAPVFNRTVTLRDTWARLASGS